MDKFTKKMENICLLSTRSGNKKMNLNNYFVYILLLLFCLTELLIGQTLTVSLGDNNHTASYEAANGTYVSMIQLKLSATGGDATITAITIFIQHPSVQLKPSYQHVD